MSQKTSPISHPLLALEAFDMVNYGAVEIPSGPVRFGFQVDLTPHIHLSEVVFGLVQQSGTADGKAVGFAVRLDLDRGEVWDLVNDSGLIGWVDRPISFSASGSDEALLLSLEIERVGSALLPKLQIGGEEWLYPAIRSIAPLDFAAVTGSKSGKTGSIEPTEVFANPSLWCDGAA